MAGLRVKIRRSRSGGRPKLPPTRRVTDLEPAEVPRVLQENAAAVFAAIEVGLAHAAIRGERLMERRTPTDRGQLKAAWKVKFPGSGGSTRTVSELVNDAPYAGIVEKGARPHGVSPEGMQSIAGWAWRNRSKLGVASKEAAMGMAFAIAAKLRAIGQDPTWFVRNSLKELDDIMQDEVARQIKAVAARLGTT